MKNEFIELVRQKYQKEVILLHEPVFRGNEKKYLNDCIDTTFVSSVGEYITRFEQVFAQRVGSRYEIATMNGTSALHIALLLAGVDRDDEVITQSLSFVATANAIKYALAEPIFIDVDIKNLGLSADAMQTFLNNHCIVKNNQCINKVSGKRIKACIPMHTLGHPCEMDKIKTICDEWKIVLVEDAAESLGSTFQNKHTGTFGLLGAFSFNGNKIITGGAGGVIVTNDENLAKRAKHITTTAKMPHAWDFVHDEVGYNYRMSNINAAVLLAQLEQLDDFLKIKRNLADDYAKFFSEFDIEFVKEPEGCTSNYWLNAILLKNKEERDDFLEFTNQNNVKTRPLWRPLNCLEMYKKNQTDDLQNTIKIESRLVNLPSGVI